MTKQEKNDARLALFVVVIALMIGFVFGTVWSSKAYAACESLQECRENLAVPYPNNPNGQAAWENDILKAIVYKLDEISEKLDRNAGPFNSMIDIAVKGKEPIKKNVMSGDTSNTNQNGWGWRGN
jgi:hypothetical protein